MDRESRTHLVAPAAKARTGESHRFAESQFVEMDGRAGERVFMARRIRSIQRQCIEPRSGNSIHPEPGGAPPENEFRGRISRAASEAWRGIRPEIRSWLAMCRPSGAWCSARMRSHRSRGGLRSFVPDGTGQIMPQLGKARGETGKPAG